MTVPAALWRLQAIEPSSLLGHIPETFESRAIAEIAATSPKSRRWLLLKNFGHRAVLDYELAEPRYAEDLNTLNRMIAGREQAKRAGYQATPALSKSLARSVDIARRFQTLKEDAKHHSLRELAVLRRAVLTLDRRFGLEGRAFYLRFDELLSLNGKNAMSHREAASKRQDQACALRKAAALPSTLTAHDLEAASAGDLSEMHALPDVIRGTHVSGSKVVEGRARVISEDDAEHGNPMEGFPRRRHHRCCDDQSGLAALLLARRRIRQRGRRLAQSPGDPGARVRRCDGRGHRGHNPHCRRQPVAAPS